MDHTLYIQLLLDLLDLLLDQLLLCVDFILVLELSQSQISILLVMKLQKCSISICSVLREGCFLHVEVRCFYLSTPSPVAIEEAYNREEIKSLLGAVGNQISDKLNEEARVALTAACVLNQRKNVLLGFLL